MEKIRADLHLHTVWSDGAYSCEEIARRCKAAGLALFSITDHDNLEGCEEAAFFAARYGLRFLRGWEISAYRGEEKVHVLGYGCSRNDTYFSFMKARKEGALRRAEEMIAKANAHFKTALTLADAERFHPEKSSPLHTMHVVSAFSEALGKDKGALYREVFARGGAAFSNLCRPTPEEAIGIIHETGGFAVLAHPGRISKGVRETLLSDLSESGLDGIECRYPTHTVTDTETFLAFAERHGLLVTGGSDFHTDDGLHFIGEPPFFPDERLLERCS